MTRFKILNINHIMQRPSSAKALKLKKVEGKEQMSSNQVDELSYSTDKCIVGTPKRLGSGQRVRENLPMQLLSLNANLMFAKIINQPVSWNGKIVFQLHQIDSSTYLAFLSQR